MDDGSFHAQMEILQQRRQNAAHSSFRRDSTPSNDRQSRVKRLRERLHPKSIGMSPSISLTSSVSSSTEMEAGKLAGLRGRAGLDGSADKQRGPDPMGICSTPTTPRAVDDNGFAPPTPGRSQSMTDAVWSDSLGDASADVIELHDPPPQRTPPHVRAKMLAWAIQGAEEEAEAVELKKQLLAQRSFGRTCRTTEMDAEVKDDTAVETSAKQPSEQGPRTPPLVSAPVTPETGPQPGRARGGAWQASPEDALEGFGEHAPCFVGTNAGLVTPLGQEVKRKSWNSVSPLQPDVGSTSKAQPYAAQYPEFFLDEYGANAEGVPELGDADANGPEHADSGTWGAEEDHGRQHVTRDDVVAEEENNETVVERQASYENADEAQLHDEAPSPGTGGAGQGEAAGSDSSQHEDQQGDDASPFRAWMAPVEQEDAFRDRLEEEVNMEDTKMCAIEEEAGMEEPQGGAELEMTASDVYYGRRGGEAFMRSHEPVSESDADTAAMPSWKTTPLAPENWGPRSLELASESEVSEAPLPVWQASAMKPKRCSNSSLASGRDNLVLATESQMGLPVSPFWGGLHLESETEAEEDAAINLLAARPEEARNAGVKGVRLSLAESEDEVDGVPVLYLDSRSSLTKMSSHSVLNPSQSGVPGFPDGDATESGGGRATNGSQSGDEGRASRELERKWEALEQKWADSRVQMRRAARMAAAMKAAMSTPATMSGSVSVLSSDSEASSVMLGSGSGLYSGHRRSATSGFHASVDPTALHTRLEALAGDGATGDKAGTDAAESESEIYFGSALGLVRQGASKRGAGWGDIPTGAETPDTMPASSRASVVGLEGVRQSRDASGPFPSRPLDEDLEALRAAQEAWEQRAKAAEREARSLRRQSEQMQEVSRTTEASLRAELDVLRSAHERARRRQIEERGKWRRAAFQLRAALGMLLPEIQEDSGDGAGNGSGEGENKTALVQRGIFTALTCLIDAGEQQDDEGSDAMAIGTPGVTASSIAVHGAGPALPGFPGFNAGATFVGGTRLLLESSSSSSTAAATTVPEPVCLITSNASHGEPTGTTVPLVNTAGTRLNGDDQSEAEDHDGSSLGGAPGGPGAVVGLPKLPVRRTPNGARSHVARTANAILKRNVSGAVEAELDQEVDAPVVGPAAGLGEALRELHELEQRQQLLKQQQEQDGASAPGQMGAIAASPPQSPSRVQDMPREVIWRSGRDSSKHMVVKRAADSAHNEWAPLGKAEAAEEKATSQVPSFSEFIAECQVPAKAEEGPKIDVSNDARGGAPKSAIFGVVQKAGNTADSSGTQTAHRPDSGTPQRSAIFGVVNSSLPGAGVDAAGMPNACQPPEQRSAILGLIAQGEAERAEEGGNSLAQSGEFEFSGWGSGFTVKKTFEVLANKGTANSPLPIADPVSDAETNEWKENMGDQAREGQRLMAHECTAAEPKRSAIMNGGPHSVARSTKPSDVDQEKLLDTLEKWMMHQRQQAFGSSTKPTSKQNISAPGEALAPVIPPTKGHTSAGRGSGDEAETGADLFEDGSLESRLFQKVLARQQGLAGIKPHQTLSSGDGPATPSKGYPVAQDGGCEAGWMEIKASPVVQSRSPRKAPRKLPVEIEETSPGKWKPIPPLGTPLAEAAPVEVEESSSFKWRLGRGQASPKPEPQKEAVPTQKEAGHPSDYYTESDNDGNFMELKQAERHISRMPGGSGRSGRGLSRRAFGMSPGRPPVQSRDSSGRRALARGYPSLSSYNKGNVTPPRSFLKATPGTPQPTIPAEPSHDFAERKTPLSPLPASKSKPTIPNSPMFMASPLREPPRETLPPASPRRGASPLHEAIPPSPIAKAAHTESVDVGIGVPIGSKGGLLSKISFGLIKKKNVSH